MLALVSILIPLYVGVRMLEVAARETVHPAVRLFAGIGVVVAAVVIGLLVNMSHELSRTLNLLESGAVAGF